MKKFAGAIAFAIHLKPWVLVATVLAVFLAAYYGFLGVRFWSASREAAASASEIARISNAARRGSTREGAEFVEPRTVEQRLEELQRLYQHPVTDDLLTTIATVAGERSVAVTSMAVGEARTVTEVGIQYQVQPMTLTVLGRTADIQGFLTGLHSRAPVTTVVGARLTGLDSSPSAQLNLLFYLDPRPAPKGSKPQPTPTPSTK